MVPTAPPARAKHGSTTIQGDSFMIFGGINSIGYLNDMFMFNVNSNTWIEIELTTEIPARANACITYFYPFLYIFGGENNSGVLNDLWLYDFRYNYI